MFSLFVVFLNAKAFNPKVWATLGVETLRYDFSEHTDAPTVLCYLNTSFHKLFVIFYTMAQVSKGMEKGVGVIFITEN